MKNGDIGGNETDCRSHGCDLRTVICFPRWGLHKDRKVDMFPHTDEVLRYTFYPIVQCGNGSFNIKIIGRISSDQYA